MADGYFFGGHLYITPATMSLIDDTAMQPTSLTVGNVLAIIGPCDGGQPLVPLSFGNPAQVDAVLVSGPLHHAVKKAFNPSNASDVNAANTVIAMRVGAATQATLTLLDASANQVIILTTNQYGLLANRTKVMVASGSVTGKAVTVQVGSSYYTQDNLARTAFEVQYSGGQSSAAMSISNSQVTLYAPTGTSVAVLALATFTTVAQLVDAISAVTGFEATVEDGQGGATAALNGLDSVTAQDVKTSLYSATANLQAVVDWINGPAQGFVTAARVANAGAPPTNIGWTYMSGGTAPAPITGDWTNALTALQSVDVQWVVPLTSTEAIWAAVDAHVQYMSTVARKERRAFVGPAIGTTLSAVEALGIQINSDRTAIVYPGHYDFSYQTGALTLYDSFMSAAIVAAGFAGMNPGGTMTNHALTVRGLEFTLRNPTDTDPLIQAGICPLDVETNGFVVTRAVSTWLQNNNFNRVEVSCGAATDFVARNVRNALDVLRGQGNGPRVIGRAVSITQSTLTTLAKPQPAGPGVIVGDANSPAFQNIVADAVGDAVEVAFQCSPVIPVNFIPITISIVPYSGTATSSTSSSSSTSANT